MTNKTLPTGVVVFLIILFIFIFLFFASIWNAISDMEDVFP